MESMDRIEKLIFIASVLIGFAAGCADTGSIASVAQEVRSSMTYQSEGDRDVWRTCGTHGDCEDMALCAIVGLQGKGIPATIGVYIDPKRGAHAVAVVNGWIIDNGHVRPRNHQRFIWEGELRGDAVWMTRINGKAIKPHRAKDVIAGPS